MPRYQIVLPDGTIIVYGWDPFLGFLCEARQGRRKALDYDAFSGDRYQGLPVSMRELVAADVVTQDQTEAALDALLQVDDIGEIADEVTRAIATIAFTLRQAATDEG